MAEIDRWRSDWRRSRFLHGNEEAEDYGRSYRDYARGNYERGGGTGGLAGRGVMRAGADYRGRGPKGYARSSERIREDVCDRLTDDAVVDASNIDVSVADSEITLRGTVASREERRRAEILAEQVTGVTHVQNDLRVNRGQEGGAESARSGRAGTAMQDPIQAAGTSATTGFRRRTRTSA